MSEASTLVKTFRIGSKMAISFGFFGQLGNRKDTISYLVVCIAGGLVYVSYILNLVKRRILPIVTLCHTGGNSVFIACGVFDVSLMADIECQKNVAKLVTVPQTRPFSKTQPAILIVVRNYFQHVLNYYRAISSDP